MFTQGDRCTLLAGTSGKHVEKFGHFKEFLAGNRNALRALAELEMLGLLAAPHTSAGRMPTEIGLRLAVSDGAFTLEIKDDGRGFSPEAKRESGNGLRNMAERMEDIGGDFRVRSATAQGTTVSLRLPIPRNEGEDSGRRPPATQLGDSAGHPQA